MHRMFTPYSRYLILDSSFSAHAHERCNAHVSTTSLRLFILCNFADGLQDEFNFEELGEVELRGKGAMRTYYLTGLKKRGTIWSNKS